MSQPPGGWFQGWLAKWLEPAVLVNVALFLVTFGAFVVYAFILVAMLRQLGEMHDTAQGTLQLATITQQSERPHFVIDIDSMKWDNHPPETPGRSLKLDVRNYGKSPGRITRFLIHAVVVRPANKLEAPASTPVYRENEAEPVGVVVVPTQKVAIETSEALHRCADEVKLYTSGEGWLYVYGFFEFAGVHDAGPAPYRSAFGFRYDPHNSRFVYLTNPNYWTYQ